MKKAMALLLIVFILSGCSGTKDAQDKLLEMREKLSRSEYAFLANIHADFGEHTYDFVLNCRFDTAGGMTFTVNSPETISGITGQITASGGALTFDDKAVAFCLLADGEISPVSAPWLVVKGLRGGFLSSWREEGSDISVCIDDSFAGSPISFQVQISKDLQPVSAEVIWEGRCILSVTVENFRYL